MSNGNGFDPTPSVRIFTADESRANRLREIATDLRALARSPFPPARSLSSIAAELEELAGPEFHRGTDFAAIRAANLAAIPEAERVRLAAEDARWLENERRRS